LGCSSQGRNFALVAVSVATGTLSHRPSSHKARSTFRLCSPCSHTRTRTRTCPFFAVTEFPRVRWTKLADPPQPLSAHGCWTVPGNPPVAYFFGGEVDAEGKPNYSNTLFRCELRGGTQLVWSPVETVGHKPSPRGWFSCCWDAAKRRAVLFGGEQWRVAASYCDVYFFYPDERRWELATVTGGPPPPRSAHTAVLACGGRLLVVFGGYSASLQCCLNDVWTLDLATLVWSERSICGPLPPPRCWHCAELCSSTEMVVYGGCNYSAAGGPIRDGCGVWVLDTEPWSWSFRETALADAVDEESLVRFGHGCCVRSVGNQTQLIIYGGYGLKELPQQAHSVMGSIATYILDIHAWRWSVVPRLIPVHDGGPSTLTDFSMRCVPGTNDNTIMVVGGRTRPVGVGDHVESVISGAHSYLLSLF